LLPDMLETFMFAASGTIIMSNEAP